MCFASIRRYRTPPCSASARQPVAPRAGKQEAGRLASGAPNEREGDTRVAPSLALSTKSLRTCVVGDALNSPAPGRPIASSPFGQKAGPWRPGRPGVSRTLLPRRPVSFEVSLSGPSRRLPTIRECSGPPRGASGPRSRSVERAASGGAEAVHKPSGSRDQPAISVGCTVPNNHGGRRDRASLAPSAV